MKMRDSELCRIIDQESRNAIGVDDTFAADRRHAMEFYLGEAKGELAPPEVTGRSKVVSKDLMDTVEWAMPGLMEALTGDDIVAFEPDNEQDEQGADDATKYVSHLIFERNNGFTTLYDAIKSCLIARMGVVKVYCDKSSVEKEETYQGVSLMELQELEGDPEIEIVSVEPYGEQPLAEGMPPELAQSFTVKAKVVEQREKFCCEGVPPEEIRISKDCRTIDDVRFIAHEVEKTVSDLISEGWPEAEVAKIPTGGTAEGDEEEASRHDYDNSQDYDNDPGDPSQRKVMVTEAYVRVDFDGDGKAEYRRVLKAGTYVHENEVTDDHPFALFSPVLMPYKVIGLSFYDLMEDLQRIKTALTRQTLDNVYLANLPMKEVVEGRVNLDDLLNPKLGGLVRVKELGSVREIVTPFIAGQTLPLLEMVDQTRNTRTGVTETNSALNAESLAKGAVGSEGVQSMMQAGAQRQKLIARVLAETGLKRMHLLFLKNVTQYMDRADQIKVAGKWIDVDPREWKTQYRVSVKVGLGAHDKAQEIANLSLIGQAQEKLLMGGLIAPDGVLHTTTKMLAAMGYKDPDQFIPRAQPKPPQPDPAVQLEQVKQQGAMQLEQMKGQVQTQLAQVQAQADVQTEQMKQSLQQQQAAQELEMQAQRDRAKLQGEMELEQFKAQLSADVELQKAQIQRQTQVEIAQMNAQVSAMTAANKVPDDRQD